MNPLDPETVLAALLDRHPRGVLRSSFPASAWRCLESRGYELQGEADVRLQSDRWFHPGRFRKQRRGQLGQTLHTWGTTPSTNLLAQGADDETALPGSVWVADEQTAGRGRQGRSWVAPRHLGLLFSVLLPVDLRHASVPQVLPLALGVGLCDTLQDVSGLPLQLKWPNDLVSNGRKLGGLLLESSGTPVPRTILGVGINVGLDAASLDRLGVPAGLGLADAPRCAVAIQRGGFREELLARLLESIESQVRVWEQAGGATVLDDWRRRDALHGRRVRAAGPEHVVEGLAQGVDEHGRLRVVDAQGRVHRFSSVEVHLL